MNKFIVGLLLVFVAMCSDAIVPKINFASIGAVDGLSQPDYSAAIQDWQGFMWFGTATGLIRFDGYQFKIFRFDPDDPYSLSNDQVRLLFIDHKQQLWVGTAYGLNRFDHRTERFTRFLHDPADGGSINHNDIRAMTANDQGQIWIGTLTGLNCFDASSQSFQRYEHDSEQPTSIGQAAVLAMAFDSQNKLWVGTWGAGLYRQIDLNDGQFERFTTDSSSSTSLSSDYILSLAITDDDQIWIGTQFGLNRYYLRDKYLSRFYKHQSMGLAHDTILSLYVDQQARLWVGTVAGLQQFDVQQQRFIDVELNFDHQVYKGQKISIWSIYVDSRDGLWLSTSHGMLRQLDSQGLFPHFVHDPEDPLSISDNDVTAIVKSGDSLWIGTRNGLNRFDEQQGFIRYFQSDDVNSLLSNQVLALAVDNEQVLWVATVQGLSRYRSATDDFVNVAFDKTRLLAHQTLVNQSQLSDPHYGMMYQSVSENIVTDLFIDRHNQVWIGTLNQGLWRYLDQGEFEYYQYESSRVNGLSGNCISGIGEDPQGRLWVATDGDGLNRMNPDQVSFTQFRHQAKNPKSLSCDKISALHVATNGQLWLGTYGCGLNRYDPQYDTFQHLDGDHGLIGDHIYAVLEDDKGQLWISTERGVSQYSPALEQFVNYDSNDGLRYHRFHSRAAFAAANGELFVAGGHGFHRFWPHRIRKTQRHSALWLVDLLQYGQSVAIADPTASFSIPQSINTLETLQLKSDFAGLSFVFSALDFTHAHDTVYAYQLQGWDQNWIYTDASSRIASYVSLPVGEYQLRLKAKVSHGQWYEQSHSLRVNVSSVWWSTWWARIIWLLLAIFIMVMIRASFRQRKQYRIKQQTVQALQKADLLKTELLLKTAHELRTPINGMIGLAENLMDGVAGTMTPQAQENLALMISSGHRLIHLVNDILDFSPQQNMIHLKRQSVSLHHITELIIKICQPLIGDKALVVSNQVAEDLVGVYADPNRLQQILYNLIGNSIKYSQQGEVVISAAVIDGWMRVMVSDEGIGIEQQRLNKLFDQSSLKGIAAQSANQGHGFGLAITKQLVELHGGNIWITSQLGQGSCVYFNMPCSDQQPVAATLPMMSVTSVLDEVGSEQEKQQMIASMYQSTHNELKILLVDDESVNRQIVRNYLSIAPFVLTEVVSGKAALALFDEHRQFDLILLDIMMPGIDGYEVCQQIRERYSVSELPIIFLTAKNQVIDLIKCFDIGGNDFLSKPIAKNELLSRLKIHLDLLQINRHLEFEVNRRSAQLLQVTEAKSEFLTKMSDEIRTPMNAVIGLSRLTLKTALTDQQKDHIEKVVDAGEVLLGQINDILDFSKIEAGKLIIESTVFDLGPLVQRAVGLSAMNAHVKGLELITDIDSNIPRRLKGDPLRIQQIMVNLMNHAIKFVETGFICFRMGIKVRLPGKVLLHCVVVDTGGGITVKQQQQLFDSLHHSNDLLSRDHGCTGLGLAISQQLCELMGGEIWLKSKPGIGSELHFTLMVDDSTTALESEYDTDEVFTGLKALVVEDVEAAANVAVRLLSELGVDCIWADSVADARQYLQQAEQQHSRFDLMFVDWQMPDIDHLGQQESIWQQNPMQITKVLLVSAYDRDKALRCCQSLGFDQVIEKPLNLYDVHEYLLQFTSKGYIQQEQQEHAKYAPNLHGFRLLLIEDNAINRQVILGFLEDTQVMVDCIDNHLTLVSSIQNQYYDLVIMDIEDSPVDGLIAVKQLRKQLRVIDLPVIVMTAQAMDQPTKQNLDQRVSELIKPIEPQALYHYLDTYLSIRTKDTLKGFQSEQEQGLPLFLVQQAERNKTEKGKRLLALGNIEGLDKQQALKRLNYRDNLYLDLVKDFVAEQGDGREWLKNLAADGVWDQLYQRVRSLKANSAYIGALELSDACIALENAISEDQDKQQHFNLMLTKLEHLYSRLYPLFNEEQVRDKTEFCVETFKNALLVVLPLLRTSNFSVENHLPGIVAICQGGVFETRIKEVMALVDDIEFERATEITEQILRELG